AREFALSWPALAKRPVTKATAESLPPAQQSSRPMAPSEPNAASTGDLSQEIETAAFPVDSSKSPETVRRQVGGSPPECPLDKLSIVVVPFKTLSGDSTEQHFSDGITNDIIADLSHLSRDSANLAVARGTASASGAQVSEIGHITRRLGVAYLVCGSV